MGWLYRGAGPVMARQPSSRFIRAFPFQVLWALYSMLAHLDRVTLRGGFQRQMCPL